MWFLLGTVLTLLVVIDYAAAACGLSTPTNNVSMCNWQGLRGKNSLCNSFRVDFFFTDTNSQYPTR